MASFGYRDVPEVEKAGLVRDVFSSVARRYDLVNTVLSGGTDAGWRRRAARATGLRPELF